MSLLISSSFTHRGRLSSASVSLCRHHTSHTNHSLNYNNNNTDKLVVPSSSSSSLYYSTVIGSQSMQFSCDNKGTQMLSCHHLAHNTDRRHFSSSNIAQSPRGAPSGAGGKNSGRNSKKIASAAGKKNANASNNKKSRNWRGASYSSNKQQQRQQQQQQQQRYSNSPAVSQNNNKKQSKKHFQRDAKKGDQTDAKRRVSRRDTTKGPVVVNSDSQRFTISPDTQECIDKLISAAKEHQFDRVHELYQELRSEKLLGELRLLRNEKISNAIVLAFIEENRIKEAEKWFQWLYRLKGSKKQEGYFVAREPVALKKILEHHIAEGNMDKASSLMRLLFINYPSEVTNVNLLHSWMESAIQNPQQIDSTGDAHSNYLIPFFEAHFQTTAEEDAYSPETILAREASRDRPQLGLQRVDPPRPQSETLTLLLRASPSWETVQYVQNQVSIHNITPSQEMIQLLKRCEDAQHQEDISSLAKNWEQQTTESSTTEEQV